MHYKLIKFEKIANEIKKIIQMRIQIWIKIRIQIQIEFGPVQRRGVASWLGKMSLFTSIVYENFNRSAKWWLQEYENSSANSYSSANTNLLENFD